MKTGTYLGIIDWGIGGIGILKELRKRRGEVPVLYFSDTGATPYGKMPRTELVARLNAVIDQMVAMSATHLIVGCNAASTVLPFLTDPGIPVKGVIESAVNAAAKMKPKRLAIIGGRRTIVSGVYRRAFQARGIEVEQRVAQPLSALIERGDVSSPTLREECVKILSPIRNSSHLLLACTHYPAIADVLREFVSPETTLLDPADALIRDLAKWKLPSGGESRFLTTGDPAEMKKAAFAAWGVRVGKVEFLSIE